MSLSIHKCDLVIGQRIQHKKMKDMVLTIMDINMFPLDSDMQGVNTVVIGRSDYAIATITVEHLAEFFHVEVTEWKVLT